MPESPGESPPVLSSEAKVKLLDTTTSKRISWDDKLPGVEPPIDPMTIETRTKLISSLSTESRDPSMPNPTFALHRSARKMDSLFELRRVGPQYAGPDGEAIKSDTEAPTSPSPRHASGDEEQGEALLHGTLRCLTDSEADLRLLEGLLSNGLEDTKDVGGARHATAVISLRTLQAVRRKASLLHDVEGRLAAVEETHAVRDETLPKVAAGQEGAPPALVGIKKFVREYTHLSPSPADDNKSDYQAFVRTFKLPARHKTMVKLRELADQVGEWWAEACLSEAEKGAVHAVLRRVIDVALATGVDKEHPKIIRAMRIINDRLAERVLREAKERLEQDLILNASQASPPVGPAFALGDRIEADVDDAVKEGVPAKDPRLKESLLICKELREKDGERRRLAAREKRLAGQG